MPPKLFEIAKENETKKSILVIPSTLNQPNEEELGEETEIAAQITVPHEGGWGWVVVFGAFWSIFIMDGVCFTFGSIFADLSEDIGVSESSAAFVNSIAVSLYFFTAPIVSAFINRFGFRASIMTGSVICLFSLLCTYFATNYGAICVFYGAFAGVGYCFINMASSLVVGFYFERLRAIALATATTGSSFGIMVMFPFNTYIVKIAGWRSLTMLHAGLFGIVFFLGMTYRPLLSLTVMKTTEDPTRTVTYLPSLAVVKGSPSRTKQEGRKPTATERLFSAVSNVNFPTAAAVVDEGAIASSSQQPGPSTAATTASKLTIKAQAPQGGITQRQLKQVQSIMSKASVQDKSKRSIEVTVQAEAPKKRSCWARLCSWEQHVPEARPMYRDDAFYDGHLKKLPVYQKSMMDTSEPKTGLEYQLAVSRAVTTADLQEKRGVFTTAARRTLATMMDPVLLKKCSFIMLGLSGFLTYLGYLVPYVFLPDRNRLNGIDPTHCSMFVSAIGCANAFGRLILGALACKFEVLRIFSCSCLIAGIGTMLSNLSYNVYYQYFYCVIFGFFIASIACLRSMVLVQLFGLEKLTNATGMALLFIGVGCLISTPLASTLKQYFGYSITFYVAGAFITLSGFVLMPIQHIAKKEGNTI